MQGEVWTIFQGSLTMMTTETNGDFAIATNDTLAEWTGEMAADCDDFE